MRELDGFETTYVCATCGGKTEPDEAWKLISRMGSHKNPKTNRRCASSGEQAGHTKRLEIERTKCPGCVSRTRWHKSSGWTERHLNLITAVPCIYGIGGTRAFEPQPIKLRPIPAGRDQPNGGWSDGYPESKSDTWNVSGGLPTLGNGR